jgi:hypothetical protein
MKHNSSAHIKTQPFIVKDAEEPVDDWSASFKSESDIAAHHSPTAATPENSASARRRLAMRVLPVVVLGVCVGLAGAWFAWQAWAVTPARAEPLTPVVAEGTAVFNSVPEGASIAIDGTLRGVTPLRVSLPVGAHSVEITSGAVSRQLPLTIEAGSVISQYVELAAAPVTLGGRLEIGSDPPGAQVTLDGVPKGTTPVVVADVAPGQHRVTVSAGDNTINRTVNVTRGTTATLVVSTAPGAAGATGGWLTVQTPIDMEILQDGRILGSTRMERVMLPVGSHRIEFANAGLEVSVDRTVQIAAGKTVNLAIALPSGRLSVNAVPWADVSLDGVAVGTTPLGELTVPIGPHELTFRHPQLGERRQSVTVKAQTPTRIGIDLRK